MTTMDISKEIAQRFKDVDDKLAEISGQIGEMKREMVTRKEYNDAHSPLLKLLSDDIVPKVRKHENIYRGATRGLLWLGAATLVSAIVSPHWAALVHGVMEFFK